MHNNFIRLLLILLVIIVIFVLIQVVPYAKDLTNPPVIREPNWDNPQTRELTKRACFDCHSNETVWPWYSRIAPVSWMVYRDTIEGRQKINFSDWQSAPIDEPEELSKVIIEGEMPPLQYLLLHPPSRLSSSEKGLLITGLLSTISK